MPAVLEPTRGQKNVTATTSFRNRSKKDLWAVVSFNPGFKASLPATVTFNKFKTDKLATVTFNNAKTITSLPATITFHGSKTKVSLAATVSFKVGKNLNASASFPYGHNIPATVSFVYKKTIPATVFFGRRGNADLQASVFLGGFHQVLPATVTFRQSAKRDFSASISVQPYNAPHVANFSSILDRSAVLTVRQKAHKDLSSTVNFRQHAKADLPVSVYIGIRDSASLNASTRFRTTAHSDLTGTITFNQLGYSNFKGAITINNPAQGTGGVTVVGSPSTTAHSINVTAVSDATGYFELINLVPGDYLVTPYKNGYTFNPPSTLVTITNHNVNLYFFTDQSITQDVASAFPPLSSGCVVNGPTGNAGTFSIYGYIFPTALVNSNPLIIAVATDEVAATNFRNTLV